LRDRRAVGNVAGQLAKKLRGCCGIGSAGSAEKVGFCGRNADSTVRPSITKAGPVLEQLTNREAPDGTDVYFDNGAAKRSSALRHCASTAGSSLWRHLRYNEGKARPALRIYQHHHETVSPLKGLIVSDLARPSSRSRTGKWVAISKPAKLKHKERWCKERSGSWAASSVFISGQNIGQEVVR